MADISDDIELPSAGPVFGPAPDCPCCRGSGVVREARGLLECTCLLRQRAVHYLTPRYGPGITWDADFDPKAYQGRDVIIRNPARLSIPQFRQAAYSAVKSFLLTTGMRLSHSTLTPYDVFRHLFKTDDTQALHELSRALDVLVLIFEGDEPRETYATQLPWLIRKRRDEGVATWLLLAIDTTDDRFGKDKGKNYVQDYKRLADPLNECIADGFVELTLPRRSMR